MRKNWAATGPFLYLLAVILAAAALYEDYSSRRNAAKKTAAPAPSARFSMTPIPRGEGTLVSDMPGKSFIQLVPVTGFHRLEMKFLDDSGMREFWMMSKVGDVYYSPFCPVGLGVDEEGEMDVHINSIVIPSDPPVRVPLEVGIAVPSGNPALVRFDGFACFIARRHDTGTLAAARTTPGK